MNINLSIEEDHWATARAELESGQRRPGVWAKAFAESEGDETKAKVAYLKAAYNNSQVRHRQFKLSPREKRVQPNDADTAAEGALSLRCTV